MNTKTLDPITKAIVTCSPKPKIEHKVKKFIRRVKEAVKPTHCAIRYDGMRNTWAVLNDDHRSPHHHFEYGVMTNVTFQSESISGYDAMYCRSFNGFAGIATGDLRENYYGNDAVGFKHMSFNPTKGFIDATSGEVIKQASVLRLMPDRRALYK